MSENSSNAVAHTAETKEDNPLAQIQTSCPRCGAAYEVDASYIGTTVTCGMCSNDFIVNMAQGNEVLEDAVEGSAENKSGVIDEPVAATPQTGHNQFVKAQGMSGWGVRQWTKLTLSLLF